LLDPLHLALESTLGEIVADLIASGAPPDPELLAHVSPLGWEHINLTGEYRWTA
jgi:hypothetical protein